MREIMQKLEVLAQVQNNHPGLQKLKSTTPISQTLILVKMITVAFDF